MNTCLVSARVLFPLATISACDFGGGDCTGELQPMIVASVSDAETGQDLVAGVTLVAYSGSARDSVTYLAAPVGEPTIALFPRILGAGTYTVEIRHPNYQTWQRQGVIVRTDRCHKTIPTSLVASLDPL